MLDPAAGLTQVLSDRTITYLYGNARLAQYQAEMQYFGADGLGSVRQIYDAGAVVVGSTRYDPFGNVMSQSGTATSVFAFAGEQQDATGLTYLRARYYSAAQGRFTTRDVWEGDPNAPMSYNGWLYAYANAVNLADPSGRIPTSPPGLTKECQDWLCDWFPWLPGCKPPAPTPTTTPSTEFSGYVLLLACGADTDCVNGRYNLIAYPQLPLQPLQTEFRKRGGVANYVPGYFTGSLQVISEVGTTIAGMIKDQQNTGTKGVFLVGHSLGGNLVVDGVARYRAAAQDPSLVKGIVLLEPDLVDRGKPDYDSRLDTQDQATTLSREYPMLIVGRSSWFAPSGQGPSSMPTPGSSKLQTYTSSQATAHTDLSTVADVVDAVIDFFLRHR